MEMILRALSLSDLSGLSSSLDISFLTAVRKMFGMSFERYFVREEGIPSGPGEEESFNLEIACLSSLDVICMLMCLIGLGI